MMRLPIISLPSVRGGTVHFQVVGFENRQDRYVLFTRVDHVYDLVFRLCLF